MLVFNAAAQAQPARVFVAAQGSNPCTFALPCRSFQQAHDTVVAGGEIDVLDPAGYGAVNITKAISIQGHGFAGLAVPSGAGITVNAGGADKINLRGLLLDGIGTGSDGVWFNTGGALHIQDSLIRNFGGNAIDFAPNNSSRLSVSTTVLADNIQSGIFINPTGSGTIVAVLDHVNFDGNGSGLIAFGGGSTAILRTTRSTIAGNTTGVNATSSGQLVSFGDNSLAGNTTDGAFTSTIALQ